MGSLIPLASDLESFRATLVSKYMRALPFGGTHYCRTRAPTTPSLFKVSVIYRATCVDVLLALQDVGVPSPTTALFPCSTTVPVDWKMMHTEIDNIHGVGGRGCGRGGIIERYM